VLHSVATSSIVAINPRIERDLERLKFVLHPDAPSNLPNFVGTVDVVHDIRFAVLTRLFVTCGSTSLSVKGNWVRLRGSSRQHCSACSACESHLPSGHSFKRAGAGHG